MQTGQVLSGETDSVSGGIRDLAQKIDLLIFCELNSP
jgi:hypothetical protein